MEDKKVLTPQELAQKIEELTANQTRLSQENEQLKKERDDLQNKVNSFNITGLTKQVETPQPVKDEEVQFDFDM